ncbi:MAG TPA: SpoIIE family protein phosphatase [Solirubrobacteraceae bacterium]|nr:SpoIIE family protein phosphatase [Solirubrobacteraceae bacterium]
MLAVGDVVGKGVAAARRAVFVRTSLVTSAPFEDDPGRLLRLANAALIDRAGTSVDYVTAVCVVHRPADGKLAWAIAGHPPPRRFGEERLQSLVASYAGSSATSVVENLRAALADYSPVAGDDVCLLAARNQAAVGSGAHG